MPPANSLPSLPATQRTPQQPSSPRGSVTSPRRHSSEAQPLPDVLTPRTASELVHDLALEQDARQRHARAQRRRNEGMHKVVAEMVLMENRRTASELRDVMDQLSCRDVTRRLAKVQPADEEEQTALSEAFNKKLAALYPEARGHMWFKLFQVMDNDGSGRVSYVEFVRAIRKVLREDVTPSRMEALWRALDEDSSGFIVAGEFAKFMRKGWYVMRLEQERIKGARTRPVWCPTVKVAPDVEEVKLKLEERKAERVRSMRATVRDNVTRLQEHAAELEKEAQQAELQLQRLRKGLQPPSRGQLRGSVSLGARPTTVQ